MPRSSLRWLSGSGNWRVKAVCPGSVGMVASTP